MDFQHLGLLQPNAQGPTLSLDGCNLMKISPQVVLHWLCIHLTGSPLLPTSSRSICVVARCCHWRPMGRNASSTSSYGFCSWGWGVSQFHMLGNILVAIDRRSFRSFATYLIKRDCNAQLLASNAKFVSGSQKSEWLEDFLSCLKFPYFMMYLHFD